MFLKGELCCAAVFQPINISPITYITNDITFKYQFKEGWQHHMCILLYFIHIFAQLSVKNLLSIRTQSGENYAAGVV